MSYRDIALARTGVHEGRRNPADKPLMKNTDLIGVIAEGELAKRLNLPFNEDLGIKGDPGYDFVLLDGRTLDVKGTERENGNLLVPAVERKPLSADLYVLAVVDVKQETARFVGYATQEEVRNAPTKDYGYGYGPAYFISWRNLHPMSDLVEWQLNNE